MNFTVGANGHSPPKAMMVFAFATMLKMTSGIVYFVLAHGLMISFELANSGLFCKYSLTKLQP